MGNYFCMTLNRRPTIDDECGTYMVIIDGKYWGHYFVGRAWHGQKFVSEADQADGLPWN